MRYRSHDTAAAVAIGAVLAWWAAVAAFWVFILWAVIHFALKFW